MNTAISVVSALEPQHASSFDEQRDGYQAYASGLKRAGHFGRLLGGVWFELTPEFTAGRMPIIDQVDITDTVINDNTIYDPVLKITGSRPCPAEFTEPPAPEPTTSAPKTSTSGGSALRLVDPLDDTVPF